MPDSLVVRMQSDLKQALKDRNKVAVSVLRVVLSDIANAEAVDIPAASGSVSAAPLGQVGLSEDVPRRELTSDDILEVIRRDVADRNVALRDYEEHGMDEPASRIREELEILTRYLN